MSKNGEVKKDKRQRAVITITDKGDGTFKGTLMFEPSIRDKRTNEVMRSAEGNIAVQAAWQVWRGLKEQQRGHIIITDER